MAKLRLLFSWLPLGLVLCGCQTQATKPETAPPVIALARAQLPPAPPEVMEVRQPNFQERLLNFFSGLQAKQTKLSASSPSPKP